MRGSGDRGALIARGLVPMVIASVLAACSPPEIARTPASAAKMQNDPVVAQSGVGQHQCANGQSYWLQRRRHSGGTLCTTYSWTQFSAPSFGWNPAWNQTAAGQYCTGSPQHACFAADRP